MGDRGCLGFVSFARQRFRRGQGPSIPHRYQGRVFPVVSISLGEVDAEALYKYGQKYTKSAAAYIGEEGVGLACVGDGLYRSESYGR